MVWMMPNLIRLQLHDIDSYYHVMPLFRGFGPCYFNFHFRTPLPISQRTLFACEPRRNRTATHHQQLNSHNTMNGVQPLGSVSFFSASKPTTISQIIARRKNKTQNAFQLLGYLYICGNKLCNSFRNTLQR